MTTTGAHESMIAVALVAGIAVSVLGLLTAVFG